SQGKSTNPNTMKDKEIEKEKEKLMKLIGLPLSTILLGDSLDRVAMEVTNPAGSTLIPRVMVTNIMVYAVTTDIWMDNSRRLHTSNFQHGVRANEVMRDMELHMVASHGSLTQAKEVVHRDRTLLWCEDSKGNLPLHLAMENGHKEVASYLVKEYPQASYALNNLKISPLYLAVEHHPKDLNLVEFMFCKLHGDHNVVDKLRSGKSIVRAAIKDQNQDMLKTILKHQRDLIKCIDEEGWTPLSYAAYNGFVDIVEYIIKKFPKSINKYKNKDKSEPIHKACLGGHVEVLKIFHSNSPKSVLSRDDEGQTVLHLAAKERDNKLKHVVSYLLTLSEGRGLINKKDENGLIPLKLAQSIGNHQVEQVIRSMQ
ncbi:Protein ACCELERATED CELL DEATH 6, partial [Bienertia sinuspersici]